MPAQVKTAFAAALLSMVAFFAGIIMLPARLAGLGVDEAGTGYFLSFISLVAVGGAALLPALGRRAAARAVLVAALLAYAAAHGCFTVAQSPAQWPALLAGALLHGLGFGLSIPLLNHLVIEHSADGARAVIWRTCPWPSSAASSCLPSWNSCPAGRRRIRRRRPDFIAVGRRLRARDGPPAPLPVTTEDTRAMELSQASLLLDPPPATGNRL